MMVIYIDIYQNYTIEFISAYMGIHLLQTHIWPRENKADPE
jgi:hypothetical protein